MHRPPSLSFAAFHALLLVAATAVAGTGWPPVAAPLILVLGILGSDLVMQRRSGRRLPSVGALLLAATVAVASSIVATRSADRFAAFVPLLGCAAVAPALLVGDSRRSCRGAR